MTRLPRRDRRSLGPYEALWAVGRVVRGGGVPVVLWAIAVVLAVAGWVMLFSGPEVRPRMSMESATSAARGQQRGWVCLVTAGVLSINGSILALRGRERG
jgi:hypothetical protein